MMGEVQELSVDVDEQLAVKLMDFSAQNKNKYGRLNCGSHVKARLNGTHCSFFKQFYKMHFEQCIKHLILKKAKT